MSGGLNVRSVNKDLLGIMSGLMLGNVYFLDGSRGNDGARGDDFSHALKTLGRGVGMLQSGNHDYLLCYGAETATAAVAISQANCHIIGIGGGGLGNDINRGFVYNRVATVDGLQTTVAADYAEIAGICFVEPATDGLLVDDDGADGVFFHHNTIYGSTTASVAIRLDIEGPNWVMNDNIFLLCKLPIDTAAAANVIRRNRMTDIAAAAKGIVIGAAGHYSIIEENIINMVVGGTEVGITITSSADSCIISKNFINCNDPISDSGTSTGIWGNYTPALTGTSGASLQLCVIT